MAEQDIYGSRFAGRDMPLEGIASRLPHPPILTTPHHQAPTLPVGSTSTIGLLGSTVLPSFNLHATFAAVTYGLARYTDRVEGKDWLWPTSITANAWWNAIGTYVIDDNLTVPEAWSRLDYSQKLLLSGVSVWGLRLLYRITRRSAKRGRDDPRYAAVKKDERFWNLAFFSLFLPEAIAQTLISLPFTLSFRAPTQSGLASPPVTSIGGALHSLSIFLFSAGLFLETAADYQLEAHKKEGYDAGILREGVWSIVRHPNYLGDVLVQASFSILLLSGNLLHPLAILAPITNYIFLRFNGGNKEDESSRQDRYSKGDPLKAQQFQAYQQDVNSFWPNTKGLKSKWTQVAAAVGVGGMFLEWAARTLVL
ncbi:unnamed protein product [Clonostachys rosea]|uniref:Steroid 5-alpha reductase C-terminal domain-containing protein n=1 Tax=Bionectria ochroleuca TaxID=29856 RepID=A0ABY6TY55_BIOOC|nr:unnamed protein product [Clonostachys rosea]